jgi:hypothetical protein
MAVNPELLKGLPGEYFVKAVAEPDSARSRPQWPLWNSLFFTLFVVVMLWATIAASLHQWYGAATLSLVVGTFTTIFALPYLQDTIRPVVALVRGSALATFKFWVIVLWLASILAWLYRPEHSSDGRYVYSGSTMFDKRTGTLYELQSGHWVVVANTPHR